MFKFCFIEHFAEEAKGAEEAEEGEGAKEAKEWTEVVEGQKVKEISNCVVASLRGK